MLTNLVLTNLVLTNIVLTNLVLTNLVRANPNFACHCQGDATDSKDALHLDEISYDCIDCNASLRLDECFPEDARRSGGLLFRCLKCYKKISKFLQDIDKNNQRVRKQVAGQVKKETEKKKKEQEAAKKKKEQEAAKQEAANKGAAKRTRSTTKKGAAKRTSSTTTTKGAAKRTTTTKKGAAATSSSTTTKKGAAKRTTTTKKGAAATSSSTSGEYKFALWQRVLSEYTGFDGKFPGEIYGRKLGLYNIYFLQDHTVETNVSEDKISKPPAGAKWAKLTRKDLINQTFQEGSTKYTIIALGKGDNKHHYLCRTSTGKEIYKTVGSVQNLCGKFGW